MGSAPPEISTSLNGAKSGAGGASPAEPLTKLQTLLSDTYGEGYFNQGGKAPLLYFSVLLHSQQFELAVAFLCREELARLECAPLRDEEFFAARMCECRACCHGPMQLLSTDVY